MNKNITDTSSLKNGVKTYYASSEKKWRNWLAKNHNTEKSIWLIIYHKESTIPSVYYPEAVDQALCYGWIDSKPNKRDHESYYQFFSKRNPKSNWSKINKDKVTRLIKNGMMEKAGLDMINIAKQNGTWDALNDVDKKIIPADLQALFDKNKKAFENWIKFSPSSQRAILEWLMNAKRKGTRDKRLKEIVHQAALNIKANYPG